MLSEEVAIAYGGRLRHRINYPCHRFNCRASSTITGSNEG